MNRVMKQCVLSHLPLLELPGEFVALHRTWLSSTVPDGASGEWVYAYRKHAAAAPQAADWMQQQLHHATTTLGLLPVAEIDGGHLLVHPQDKSYHWCAAGGLLLALPPIADIEAGDRIPPVRHVRTRFALHLHAVAPTLAKEMQTALLQSKAVSLEGCVAALGIQDSFVYVDALTQARLRVDADLRATWQPDGFAAVCEAILTLPELLVQGIRNAEAGIRPRYDLQGLLREANDLSADGVREQLEAALSLLSAQAIYFQGQDRELIYLTQGRVQQQIFDLNDYNTDELDALFAGKTVDASQYSGDLED